MRRRITGVTCLDNKGASVNPRSGTGILMEHNELAERPSGGAGQREKASYFTRRPVRPGELPRLMNKHIITGTMGSAWGNLIGGIILIYFGNAIGMTQLQWGI